MNFERSAREERASAFSRLMRQIDAARIQETGDRMAERIPGGRRRMEELVEDAIDLGMPAAQFNLSIYFQIHPGAGSRGDLLSSVVPGPRVATRAHRRY